MSRKTGTYDIASLFAATNVTVNQFPGGAQEVARILAQDNAAWNASVTEMLGEFAETSSDRDAVGAGSGDGDMLEVDEYSQGPTQKDVAGALWQIPLRKFQYAVGWTKDYEEEAPASEFAIKNDRAQGADSRRTRYELLRAIFGPTNYSFVDLFKDNATLAVKAFINADSSAIPNGPNGEVFDGSTHTHYNSSATLTAAAVQATIDDVTEHRNGARVRIYINKADVTSFSALAGFFPLQLANIQLATNANVIVNPRLDTTRMDNRQIGSFNGADVWTKPWVPANYLAVIDIDAPVKPLRRRVKTTDRGLHIAGEVDVHPLRAQYIERYQGFGALNRLAVAVLKFNNASYSAPALSF
jgi:hypothetical protein